MLTQNSSHGILFIALLVAGFIISCAEHEITSPTSEIRPLDQTNLQTERPGFHLDNAVFAVDGKFETGKINLSQNEFGYLFIWLKEGGLFIVGIDPISISQEGGEFWGNQLTVDLNGHLIVVNSEGEHLFDDFRDRKAYVVHIPEFKMFKPDVRPSDFVVGLVKEFFQIPGWSR